MPRPSNKPKKSLDQNVTPQKSHAEFPSQKYFQKAEAVTTQVLFYFIQGTTRSGVHGNYAVTWNFRLFKYSQKSLLQSSYPKKYLPTFSYPKKSWNRKFQT